MLNGVSQVSVLGPLLFLCYVNDMPDAVNSALYVYADDTKMIEELYDQKDGDRI